MRTPRARPDQAPTARTSRGSFLRPGGVGRLLQAAGNRATGQALSRGGLKVLPAGGGPEKSADRAAHAALSGRGAAAGLVGRPVGRSIQRLSTGQARGGETVAPSVDRRLRQRAGGGRALSGGIRKELESGFGVDLSPVRIHTDPEAGRLTRTLGAKALTVGRDVYFAPGQFDPRGRRGKETLAHEVSHTIQQSGLRRGARGKATLGTPIAPAVQRLIDPDLFLEAVGDAKPQDRNEKRRFDKVVQSLRDYHNAPSAKNVESARTSALNKLHERCSKHWSHYMDSTPLAKWVSELGTDVNIELGKYPEKWASTKLAAIEHEAKLKLLTKDDNLSYAVRITAWITHSHYSTFAKTRAGLVAKNKLNPFSSKESSEIKVEAARLTVGKYLDPKLEPKKFKKEMETLLTADVGHTWVSLERHKKDDGAIVDQKAYGFWPSGRVHPTKEVDGDVRFPDNAHKDDQPQRSKVWTVPFSSYETALKEAERQRKSPPKYKMVAHNCTTFARDIAQKAGVEVPNAYWTVPIKGGSVWNPNDMYDAFDEEGI